MQRLLRAPHGRQPPVVATHASCSGRSAVKAHCPLLRTGRRKLVEPCRITSTSKELYQSEAAKEMGMEDEGDEAYMELPSYQIYDPEKGPLEKRIQRTFLDAVNDDKVDLRDTEYWFTTPPEGWISKPRRLYFMEELEAQFPQPWHSPEEEEAEDRIAFSELEEGRVMVGIVTDVWLYHGVQIDIGAECDGLIPCTEELWEYAVDHIDVGEVVMVEVHKLRTPGLYRWPVQLKFTVKGLQDLMVPPDDYQCPVDHGWAADNGLSADDVAALTGRTLDTPTYFMPLDEQKMAEDIIDGYGTGDMYWRERPSEPIEDFIDDPMEDDAEEDWLGRGQDQVELAAQQVMNRML